MMPVILCGPTASGKSAVAAALGRLLGGGIVCGDAFQLYQGLPILTAQPGPGERAQAPHLLYGSVPPGEDMDAARYARMAGDALAGIQARGLRPILTGGSGLYLKAVTHGLSPLPPVDAALRAELEALPPPELATRLLALDPGAAATVNLRNPRYVQRALEIVLLTGRPAAEWKTSFAQGPRPGLRAFILQRDRAELHDRVNQRTLAMVEEGVLAEVAALPPDLSATAAKTIGLRELTAVLRGGLPLAEAVTAIQQATRQYAKRQITWFRRETWMEPVDCTARAPGEIAAEIHRRLLE